MHKWKTFFPNQVKFPHNFGLFEACGQNYRIFKNSVSTFYCTLNDCLDHMVSMQKLFWKREYPGPRYLIKKKNKTWSSVSNSSLSKIFALHQFRKLKVQKLCFLLPNVILGLKKWVQKSFWVRKNVGPEKKFRSKQNLGWKKFWLEKIFCLKKFWAWKKNLGLKKI